MRISKKESGEMKCTAYNKRFGISAGVFSQKHLYEFASLSPVRTAVKPPPTPSRRTLATSVKTGDQTDTIVINNNERKDLAF